MTIKHVNEVLPNGLRVVSVEMPHLHSAMVSVYVRAGSRHETVHNNGVSHFLEHLVFRGCERFPDGRAMNARVEDVGGSLNGVTARDFGYYFTPAHPRHLHAAVEVLGAMLSKPLFKEVEIERQVILEEMLDEVDDKGRDIDIDNLSMQQAFGEHPLALKIAGTRESVLALKEEQIRQHHQQFYGAGNLVLAVAGAVRHAEVMALAEEHFADFAPGPRALDTPPLPWPTGPRFHHVEHDESQVDLRLNFPTPAERHPDFAALLVLRRVLDDGLSTRLQTHVVDRKGLAYAIGAGINTWSELGVFEIDVSCAPHKVALVAEELLRLLGELCHETVSEEELRRAQVRHRIDLEFAIDSPSDLVGWYGGTSLFFEPEDLSERIARVDAVSAADVQRVARQVFRKAHLLAVSVGSPPKAVRKELERHIVGAKDLV